jgi:acetyltransferase-like isoleucine patch superfamily enzyme
MIDPTAWISELAIIEDGVTIGPNSKIWEFSKVRTGAIIGSGVTIGMGVYVGPGVVIGRNCKIQNYALIYDPAELGDGVFIGPGAILTNDKKPSAVSSDGGVKGPQDWIASKVTIEDGVSLGAGSICVAPVVVGAHAMVAAGAVVTRDVAPHSLVVGVPARPC